eukprot:15337675-Alexandrium_andersonii.AAC.2
MAESKYGELVCFNKQLIADKSSHPPAAHTSFQIVVPCMVLLAAPRGKLKPATNQRLTCAAVGATANRFNLLHLCIRQYTLRASVGVPGRTT